MKKTPIIAIALAAFMPLLMGADGESNWQPLLISSLTTLGGYGLILGGRAISAYLRQKAKTLRDVANTALSDDDKTNDDAAAENLAKAAGMEAVADILEHKTNSK